MSHGTGAPPSGSSGSSHVGTNQWQSFEMRMRRRRAERCWLRAEVALEAGFPDEAAAALEEARKLEPDAPENAALERSIAENRLRQAAPPPRRERRWVAVAAALAIASAASAWIAISRSAARHAPDASTAVSAATASDADPTPRQPADGLAANSSASSSARVVTELIQPKMVGGEVPATAPVATTGSTSSPSSPSSIDRPETPDDAPPANVGSLPPARVNDLPLADVAPAVREAPLEPRPEPKLEPKPEPPAALPGTTVPMAPPRTAVDETGGIRSALAKYEAAYSGLDAAAAGQVWPGVDRKALARAFDALESQQVLLGRCNVTVHGATARAQCDGSTTWTPKVGRGPQKQAHSWTFDLAKQNTDWIIQRAMIK